MKRYFPEGFLLDTLENRAALRSPAALNEAYQCQRVLEARAVLCDSSHNLWVDLGCMRGVIPHSEGAVGIADGSVRDIAVIARVNKPVCFVITGFQEENGEKHAILSRRIPQQACLDEYIANLSPGDIIPARITHLEPFGAFADIGCGLPSLIPIDSISVSRIAHPRDRFQTGMDIRAVVRSVEPNGRVCLSHKELLGTWEENAARFEPGQTVAGIVRSVESYGIFVELAPNLAGLAEPREDVLSGQHASVYIKSLIPERMKVKLIVIDSFDADYPPTPPVYYVEGNHLDVWRYSPECCSRIIETRLNPDA
ncbi:MAG: S1 RNA-binding domain-containing protein [Clostridiales bacterium]|nr:S1 RNA-binding domain-containing protein [Clostridiales bacterium]